MKQLMTQVMACIITLVATTTSLLAGAPAASAQATLSVVLTEDPFICDAIVRPLGTVSGLVPGEQVEFSSPQLNGVFSQRTADNAGQVAMRWNCDAPQTWSVTVRGLTSGASASFVVTGAFAPPPADAPIGAAFDAKSAMTAEQMAIWKDYSPFNTVGVYINVNSSWDNRADKVQRNLTADWVRTVFADGWRIIPIYVGFQAPDPCQTARFEGHSNDPATARDQGFAAAADAVSSMAALGISAGNPIYYDMEAYRPGCSEAVIAFLDGWTEGVHAQGYLSGVYGSRSSVMWDLSRSLGRQGFDEPDAVWVSTGNGRPDTYGLEVPADGLWANARLHQYRLNITRTYGGVTRQIDENVGNAPLAVANPTQPQAPAPVPAANVDADGDGFTEPDPDNCDNVANPDQADLDNDGDGDVCDRDIDGDGVDNVSDFAPTDPTITTAPEPTAVPTPVVVDADGDGFAEPDPDNCDNVANPDQADLDNDGDGDVCDRDIDGDGVDNVSDFAPTDPTITTAPQPTAVPEPTAGPEAAAAVLDPTPAPEATPTATDPAPIEPTTTPEPTAETVNPQVIVLPTPLPSPTPAPTSTPPPIDPLAAPVDNNESGAGGGVGDIPLGDIELATESVTIFVEDDSPVRPYALVAIAALTAFCAAMGIRSFSRSRGVA